MERIYRTLIYIDRDLNAPEKGWGWVEVDNEVVKRFGIDTKYPKYRTVTKRKLKYDSTSNTLVEYENPNHTVRPPSRGKAGAKKFLLDVKGEIITIKAQKSLTSQAICSWIKTWASPDTKIVTPGNKLFSIDGDKLAHKVHFIYFILNEDSNAIKIGRASNLEKRMRSLQTSSPAKLRLIKSMQVDSSRQAQELERSLHQQFRELRLTGEWFKAEKELLNYINQI